MWTKKYAPALAALFVCSAMATAIAQDAPPTEAALIATLQDESGWEAKANACRALRQIGTARAVPALAALLEDPRLSHWARYALEPMAAEEAGAALRKVAEEGTDSVRTGAIISLGARKDAAAVPLLVPHLRSEDIYLARAAAGALGHIATNAAIDALTTSYDDVKGTVRVALAEGMLNAAKHASESDNAALAIALYKGLLEENPARHIQLGAFRGLAYADSDNTATLLLEAIKGEDEVLRGLAAQCIAEMDSEEDAAQYAAAPEGLSPAAQSDLLRALATRGDAAARPAVLAQTKAEDGAVRTAALKALATLGTLEDAPVMIAALDAEDAAEQEAARSALVGLRGDTVDAMLTRMMQGASDGEQAGLVKVLMNRLAPQTLRMAVFCQNRGPEARLAALDVFALMGGADQLPVALATMRGAEDAAEGAAAERAVMAISARAGSSSLSVLQAAIERSDAPTQKKLVGALARVATPEALQVLVALSAGEDADVASEAVRAISNWQSLDALPALLELAASSDTQRNVLGLRGYLRLTQSDAPRGERVAMLKTAAQFARRTEERQLLVAAWGQMRSREALGMLATFMTEADLRDTASLGIIDVAAALGRRDNYKGDVLQALEAVINTCKDAEIVAAARRTRDEIANR